MQSLFQHFINGASLGSIYALIALGYTMVYGVLQFINFAHSEVYMMGAFCAYFFARWVGINNNPSIGALLITLIVTMAFCAGLALIIERFAYRPLRKAPRLNVLITAIGVSLLLQYSGQVIFGADPKVFPNLIQDGALFVLAGVEIRSLDVTVFLVTLAMLAILQYLIHHTKPGLAIRAVSQNANVASLMGISVDKAIMTTFAIGSALAGVGSVLVGLKYPKIEPLMGTMIGLKAFVAAVLGGIGSFPGAVAGGLILGLSEEMVVAYMSSTYRDALAFGILIFVLLIKPSGLMGKMTIEKV